MHKCYVATVALAVVSFGIPIFANELKKDATMTDSAKSAPAFTNHLAGESSLYLLSHAHNPVDWYPWGPEALKRAKKLDRPIFLSIGYASCHWCHVMEHESFENDSIADILNQNFVPIKVDREQRPDLDQIYMTFTQAMTGSGGWPMSVFLTPDLKPFFAGTYFPPDDRYGRPGFKHVIEEITKAYAENKQSIEDSSKAIYDEIAGHLNRTSESALLSDHLITAGVDSLMQNFDQVHGGIGNAPKFPHPVEMSLFLHQYKRTGDLSFLLAASKALKAMARGGINDQIGGGFARYAVDERWLVPHFEKMLSDNALLALTYIEAYQITGDTFYRDVATSTLNFMLRQMTDRTGGFYSAIDADSEGEEGKFYLWTKPQIDSVLGSDADLFCNYFNVTDIGNFEGRNVLHVDASSDRVKDESGRDDFDSFIALCKTRLFEARSRRVRPLTDDKILTSWNGLALSALARGYQVTDDRRYLDAAMANAEFVKRELFVDGKLTHAYRYRTHSRGEFLEDYAYYIRGLLDLYETDRSGSNLLWLTFATQLTDRAIGLFVDKDAHFYLRPENESDLIMRPRDETDDALPAPGSVMIYNLIRLNTLTGSTAYADLAQNALKALSGQMAKYPGGMASALLALEYYLGDKVDIVLVGSTHVRDQMLEYIYRQYIPNRVIAMSPDGKSRLPVFDGRRAYDDNAVAYVCRNSICKIPATTLDELKTQLSDLK